MKKQTTISSVSSFKLRTFPALIMAAFTQQIQAEGNSFIDSKLISELKIPAVGIEYGASQQILLSEKVDDANPAGTSARAEEVRSSSKNQGKNDLPLNSKLKEITVRAKRLHEISPLRGLALTKEEIPGNVEYYR